ncbi:MAG: phenylacetic acid degradation operon negative regulatory protein PaaX [Alcaligenaceae bacterium]|nr:phenylacetic acid degradation operon negative regulatory protein PaaX [Alcaligenaceae bacterium]
MKKHTPSLENWLYQALENDPPRAKSLCVTLIGDAIEPHGGSLWLSDLIQLVVPLGINERLLRTSVFRLVAQGWLQSERHGRRSLYRLTDTGLEQTRQASERIYQGTPEHWADDWTLVVLPRFGNGGMEGRADIRRELIWAGFGALAPGIFALPRNQASLARKLLKAHHLQDQALVLGAHDLNDGKGLMLASLIDQCWDLDGLAAHYKGFCERFEPLETLMGDTLQPTQAYAIRTLLLHAWRRAVLHDPQLPVQMLPGDWPGIRARALCARLYWQVFNAAEQHLESVLGQDALHFQPLKTQVFERFGGPETT